MLHLRTMKDTTVNHDKTIEFIKDFAHDYQIVLRGTDQEITDTDESITGENWWDGGFNSRSHDVEKLVFTPDSFSFGYKGSKISGPLKGVQAETQVLVDGQESDCDQDDIEAAIEKACGFPLDPMEFENAEIEL
jgi:hypothetical protein